MHPLARLRVCFVCVDFCVFVSAPRVSHRAPAASLSLSFLPYVLRDPSPFLFFVCTLLLLPPPCPAPLSLLLQQRAGPVLPHAAPEERRDELGEILHLFFWDKFNVVLVVILCVAFWGSCFGVGVGFGYDFVGLF